MIYSEGRLNEKADYLLSHRNYCPEWLGNFIPFTIFHSVEYVHEEPVILQPQVLQTCQGSGLHTTFHENLMKAADTHETYFTILKAVLKGDGKVDTNISIKMELLLFKNR